MTKHEEHDNDKDPNRITIKVDPDKPALIRLVECANCGTVLICDSERYFGDCASCWGDPPANVVACKKQRRVSRLITRADCGVVTHRQLFEHEVKQMQAAGNKHAHIAEDAETGEIWVRK